MIDAKKTARGLLLLSAMCGCATLASQGEGDFDLASTHSGPFRSLKRARSCDENDVCTGVDELPQGAADGIPKYPGSPRSRSPSVLVRGRGGASAAPVATEDLRVVLYAARDLDPGPARIVRMESPTARNFDAADVAEVLTADQQFEGESMGDPWAMQVGNEVWLYYAIRPNGKAGQVPGIARAHSTDGLVGRAFAKDTAPALGFAADAAGLDRTWESEPPRAPSVIRLDDGSFRMFYASGNAIGEATSIDGVSFTRLAGNPVIEPSAPVDPSTLPDGVKPPFDDLAVDDPCVDRVTSEAGRIVYHVMYTGRDRRDGYAIGFAGRYGDRGKFDRHAGSVFGQKSHGNAPAMARFPSFSLLFMNQDENITSGPIDVGKQVLGIAITPAKIRLPFPE